MVIVIVYHCWVWVSVTGLLPFIVLTVLSANIYTCLARLRRRLTLRKAPVQNSQSKYFFLFYL